MVYYYEDHLGCQHINNRNATRWFKFWVVFHFSFAWERSWGSFQNIVSVCRFVKLLKVFYCKLLPCTLHILSKDQYYHRWEICQDDLLRKRSRYSTTVYKLVEAEVFNSRLVPSNLWIVTEKWSNAQTIQNSSKSFAAYLQ